MGLRAFCAAVVLLSVLAHVSANSQSPSRAGAADHFENAAIQASRSRSGRQLTAASRDPSLQIRGVNIYQKKTGKLIKLKGLGWYGWNIPQYGLTFGNANTGDSVTRDFRSNLWRIKRLGFNSLRLAFTFDILTRPIRTRPQQCSVASRGAIINSILYPGFSLRVPKQVPPSVRGGVCNAGMPSSGRVWDQFVWAVKEATNAGFYVVLDYHSNKNGDQAFYNPTYFLQSWKKLLKDVQRQTGTFGRILLDPVNEPDGYDCDWNHCGGGWKNLHTFYHRMFSALYSQCRNCLLLAEGGGQANGWSNYGDGFTTDARRIAQIRAYMRTRGQTKYASAVPFFQTIHNANYRRNIVLLPHIYCPRVSQALDHWQGTGLYEKLHFSFGDKQRRGFTYRGVTRRYPIINGEFGSTLENNVEKSCMRDIAKYMNNRQGKRFDHPVISSWFYWTWNADSADTGGILNSDWRSIAWQRVRFLSSNLGLRPWYRYDYRLA